MLKQVQIRKAVDSRKILVSETVFLAMLLCILPAAQAQILYGSMAGNVTDQSSAMLPSAHVEALNVGTGISHTTQTDARGVYQFPELQPGIYKVTIKVDKFTTAVV